jgi:hypothetical protein
MITTGKSSQVEASHVMCIIPLLQYIIYMFILFHFPSLPLTTSFIIHITSITPQHHNTTPPKHQNTNTPHYRRKDLFETCGDDWSTCACPTARRRIGNGDINCSTASCPRNCEVCYLCLMEYNDCVASCYYIIPLHI